MTLKYVKRCSNLYLGCTYYVLPTWISVRFWAGRIRRTSTLASYLWCLLCRTTNTLYIIFALYFSRKTNNANIVTLGSSKSPSVNSNTLLLPHKQWSSAPTRNEWVVICRMRKCAVHVAHAIKMNDVPCSHAKLTLNTTLIWKSATQVLFKLHLQ